MSALGCGVDSPDSPQDEGVRRVPFGSRGPSVDGNLVVLPVLGSASFGSQCPHGYIAPPQPSPIELVTSPTSLTALELGESLSPLLIQVDCKKNTIDVRGVTRSALATTWEFPPSGQIDFSVDGGNIQVKNDGAGNLNCTTPALVQVKGKVDCKDMDHPEIRVHFFWNLGKSIHDLNPSIHPQTGNSPIPAPTSSPYPSPSATPRPSPAPSPAVESSTGPMPSPSSSPHPSNLAPGLSANPGYLPFNFRFAFPFFGRGNLEAGEFRNTIPCKFPEDSYLQTPEKIIIKQCVN